jgi:hypothetical protein
MPNEPSSSPSAATRRWLDYRRKRFWAIVLVPALFAVYILAGFFVLPLILQGRIVSALNKTLDRPVALDGVSVNPLTLAVDLRGFRVAEKDGAQIFSLDRLHVRLSPDSLPHWAWSFGNISLEGFKGDIIRYGKGDTNIGRLIEAAAAASGPSQPKSDKDQAMPRVIVHHLSVKNAMAAFTDHVPAEPFRTEIGPVNAEIDSFGTLPDETGQQHIVIDLEKGSKLEWSSQFSLYPLKSSGHVKAKGPFVALLARYMGDVFGLSIPTGTLDTELDYRLEERSEGELALAVDHLGLTVRDLAVHEKDATAPFVTLPELHLANGHFAWPERQASADSLTVDGLSLSLRRDEDGRIALPWQGAAESAPAPAPEKAGSEWAISLGKLELRKAKGQFEDRSLREGGTIDIASVDLTVDSLSNKANADFPFSLTTDFAPNGVIKLEGKVSVQPAVTMDAKLNVTDLPVVVAQAYLHDFARLFINDGQLDAEGDVTIKDPDGLKVVGKADIHAMKLRDEVEERPVVSWDKLAIDRFVYRQAANELQVSQVVLGAPYLRFQKAADLTTNFSHIMALGTPAKQPGQQAAAPPGPTTAKIVADPIKITVGKVAVEAGTADYGDASLPLPFATHISNLQGNIFALSSAAASASGVSLHGQVDQYGELTVSGKVNPFKFAKGMKVDVVFRNVEFPGLSPYTVKFAGRRIAKGRLDVESTYAIDGGTLTGRNKIVIREMELGDKIDVPGAKDLPLDLAISLLKDEDGNINLDLPVRGNVNDPQFDFGLVVTQALSDVLGNLVTAPFRALAGLFGEDGSDALDHIDFAPGRAVLEPPEKEKIQHIAEILAKRPKVDVVVSGVVDPEQDRQKLQRDALDAEMAKELGDHDMVSRQRKFLEGLFEKRIGTDQLQAARQSFSQSVSASGGASGDTVFDDPAYLSALRKQVAKTEPIDEAGLAALGQSRGSAVADALKQVPGLAPQRVTLKGNKDVKAEQDGRVPLKLEATDGS